MSAHPFAKVAIVGAGAIGGWMGVHLARAGVQLSVLARGDTLAALQKNGLQLHQGGQLHTVPVTASNDAAALGVQDLVVIAVKGPALGAVAARIAPLIGPHTLLLPAMNGVPLKLPLEFWKIGIQPRYWFMSSCQPTAVGAST